MNFNSFGEILYFFRKKMDLTQADICKDICDRRTYMKWENDQLLPSFYYMECLSYRLNIDLISYYKLFQCHKSSFYMRYDILVSNLMKDKQYNSIKNLIPELEQVENKPPPFEQLVILCKAICLFEEKQYESSIKFCLKSLFIEDSQPTESYPFGRIFSNTGMNTLICLAHSYQQLNNENKALEIYLEALKIIDLRLLSDLCFYQSNEFWKKTCQYILYNISLIHEKKEAYFQSLVFINRALIFSNTEHCLYFLPELFQLKLKIKYHLGKYKEAYQCYKYSISLYQFQKQNKEVRKLKIILDTKYPNLKKYIIEI